MKLRTLFFRFLAIYLAGFLIMFMCSFLVAVSSFRIIRSDMLSRWNVTKERGIADIADSISDITIMNRMLIGSGNLGQLSFFRDGDDSSRAVLSLLETGDVFAEAGIIIDDFSYAFVLFRNNDIFLSSGPDTLDFSDYYGSLMQAEAGGRRIENGDDFRTLLFQSYPGGLQYIAIDRLSFTLNDKSVAIDNPILFLLSTEGIYGKPQYIMVFVLDPDSVAERILDPSIRDYSFLSIYSSAGENLLSYGDIPEGFEEYISEGSQVPGYFITTDSVSSIGWRIIAGVSEDYIWNQMYPVIRILAIYVIGGLLLAIVLSITFSLRRFGGFRHIYSEVLERDDTIDNGNEYAILSTSIQKIKDEGEEYRKKLEELSKQNAAINLLHLIEFGIHDEHDKAQFVRLSGYESPFYAVAVIRVLCNEEDGYERIIMALSASLSEKELTFRSVHDGDGNEVFIFSLENDSGLSQEITESAIAISSSQGAVIHGGISRIFSNLYRIDSAFEDARRIERSLYADEAETIIKEYDSSLELDDENPVSLDVLEKLSAFLSCGKGDSVSHILDEIEGKLEKNPFMFEKWKERIFYALDNVFSSVSGSTSNLMAEDAASRIRQMNTETMVGYFRIRAEEIERAFHDRKKSHNEELRDRIIVYMNEHFSEAGLSAFSVSGDMGISEKYLSQFLKEQTGVSFAEYLRKIRIEAAIRYLEKTDYSNEQIAELTGFGGVNTFYRNFSKQMGVTPKVYKDNFLNNKE